MSVPRRASFAQLRVGRVQVVALAMVCLVWIVAAAALYSQRLHSSESATTTLVETCRLARESVERTLESVDRIAQLAVSFAGRTPGLDASLLANLAASAPGLVEFVAHADASGNVVRVPLGTVVRSVVAGLLVTLGITMHTLIVERWRMRNPKHTTRPLSRCSKDAPCPVEDPRHLLLWGECWHEQ